MLRHFKRSGVKALNFVVEIHMTKVELKLAQQCRISVIFKRGQYRKETVNAPVLDQGVAYFDEKITIPTVFYYDEVKRMFLEKEATLALNMISSKAQRLIGITKFDLSMFLNKNQKETDVELKMDKCVDKMAKFCFRLNLSQMGELDPCTTFKEDEENLSYSQAEEIKPSPRKAEYDDSNQNISGLILTDHSDKGDVYSLSPPATTKSIESQRQSRNNNRRPLTPNETQATGNKIEKSLVVKPKDASVPNRQTRTISPITRPNATAKPKMQTTKSERTVPKVDLVVDETPKWSTNSARLVPSNQSDEKRIEKEMRNSQRQRGNILEPVQIYLTNEKYPAAQLSPPRQNGHVYFEKPEPQVIEDSESNEGEEPRPEVITQSKASLPEIEEISPKKLEKRDSNRLSNKNQVSFKDEPQNRDNEIELQLQLKNLEQTNKNLSEQLQFSNREYLILNQDYDELKQQYNMLYADYQKKTISDEKKNDKRAEFELGIYKEKVQSLQKELEELKTSKKPELLQSQTSLEGEEATLKQKGYESSSFSKLEEYKNTTSKLRNELSDMKKKLTETEAAHANEIEKNKITISELTGGIGKIRKEVEQKNQKIESLETYVQELEETITQLKHELIKLKLQPDTSHSQNSLESDHHHHHQLQEEKYMQNIRDLTHENQELKKKLEEAKRSEPTSLIKEQKSNPNFDNVLMQKEKLITDLERKITQIQGDNTNAVNELKKLKITLTSTESEKYNLLNVIKQSQQKFKIKDDRIDFLESEMSILKSQLGELMNTVMEIGSSELLDRVEVIMTTDKPQKPPSHNESLNKSVLS